MARQFFTEGTGNQQTLTPSQNEKVAVYDTVADAEADLANLSEGQIIATPDTGDELSQPVDVVESGNLHAVTSNAVAEALPKIKIKELTATTGQNGEISSSVLQLSYQNCMIIGVSAMTETSTQTYRSYIPICNLQAGVWYLQVRDGNFNPVINTSVAIRIMYIEY